MSGRSGLAADTVGIDAAALVSPLPPAPSGVAEYAARIGVELAKILPLELIGSDSAEQASKFERVICQIGNNGLHDAIYRAALKQPGIVELHDAVLNHLLLGMLSRGEYEEEFAYNEGEWMRSLGSQLWEQRALASSDERYFRYPMLRRLVESAKGVIVHNAGARRRVESVEGHPPVFDVPHYVDLPERSRFESDAALRRRWSIPEGALTVSCFGYQRPTKRLGSVLEACRAIEGDYRLLVVGEFVDEDYRRALGDRLQRPQVIRLPYVADEDFWRLAFVTDVCVNLRSPSAGETSGIALKLMAAGKAVVMTAGDETASFPEDGLIRIDEGETETEMLAEYLCWLAASREAREAIGRSAARHVGEHCSPARAVAAYRHALDAVWG